MFDVKYQLKILPDKPGVYIMKNSLGEVIYVGKAKVLKNRIRQYFQNSRNHTQKVKSMVKNIEEFEYIVTDSEIEALILECNLIKKYRPKYNILLKDDKHYPFIKITLNEDFPRVFVTRNIKKDGAKYFGPYTDSYAVYDTIELIKKIFPARTCNTNISNFKNKRPCLNYYIELCKAPCCGYISKEDYRKIIDNIIDLLSGKDKKIIKDLKKEMKEAAEKLEFEKAANLRDNIEAVTKVIEKQKIFISNFQNEDFIDSYNDDKDTCVQVFFLRNGKIVGREHFILENTMDLAKKEVLLNFIKEFYGGTAFIPKLIYLPELEDRELIEEWLTLKSENKVSVKVPLKGDKKNILKLVQKNAKVTLEQFKFKLINDKKIYENNMKQLADLLELDFIPHRIEGYDISNIQGVDSVGSMVVFEGGKPKNSDYRRFKIDTFNSPNDYDSIKEILNRRFSRGLNEIKEIQDERLKLGYGKFCVFPDVILVDGGKGQVNSALEVLKKLNINIPVCGMVKDDKHKTRGLIYKSKEIDISKYKNIMNLIAKIQDEAHRFAITYHRSLRNKRTFHSILDDIPYIGGTRKKALLKKFGSIENIKKATYDELISTESMNSKSAKSVINFFKK
ncbi:UvrABC system protein C [Clostridium acetireducens DSM 10703]|jgi:excinuclease ABC subunit C|uniref:UvrABC system protein C n=1 Tax=Clostridium acetireducens DSM 10703 TaxID=1121290 RepID=A0A1E8F1J1_9CLOT|nr:excinuclease ABC subunit UvrC [Clostridium acetireducens]OFI07493.1 UvrABC system protein C [Clostridium acetireducens DSM 10703]